MLSRDLALFSNNSKHLNSRQGLQGKVDDSSNSSRGRHRTKASRTQPALRPNNNSTLLSSTLPQAQDNGAAAVHLHPELDFLACLIRHLHQDGILPQDKDSPSQARSRTAHMDHSPQDLQEDPQEDHPAHQTSNFRSRISLRQSVQVEGNRPHPAPRISLLSQRA